MRQDAELRSLIESTEALIESYPTKIALVREPSLVPDGLGGQIPNPAEEETTLPAKERHFAPITDFVKLGLSFGELIDDRGRRMTPTHILVGPPNDDIEEGDTFTDAGQDYTILRVFPDRSYMTKGIVGQEVRMMV